ncbi:unnamed protein product [Chondrus crispus]|uniref:Uncharacterized protein n=1 Tax=Chondrus crispus TaxID=2769 RepID=R7Q641_CHOCR|nr:unnamed protein product [Chondrus crispus]CDF33972.1 unnamed protein product [Chondrus crispus]|eukprot:XP_005713791.1 unnamed protein product [Chondrus crispus]
MYVPFKGMCGKQGTHGWAPSQVNYGTTVIVVVIVVGADSVVHAHIRCSTPLLLYTCPRFHVYLHRDLAVRRIDPER